MCMILMTLLLIPLDQGMPAMLTMALFIVSFLVKGQRRYLIAPGQEITIAGIIAGQFAVQAA